jgi:hypothetical protein
MKQIILFVFTNFILSTSSFAAVKPWGLGLILATPTGFSVKHRMSTENSFDAALGYDLGGADYLHLHGTYLWEFDRELKIGKALLGYYFGVGGAMFSWDRDNDPPPWVADNNNEDDFGVAIRGSGGLNYYFADPSFEVFAEASLHFFFIPETDVDLGLAVGGRYFF